MEVINSQAAQHIPPFSGTTNTKAHTASISKPDRISPSPWPTLAYIQPDTGGSRTVGMDSGTQEHGNGSRDLEPYGEPIRGQTRALVPKFERIPPSPQSTLPNPQPGTQSFKSMDSKPRDLDPSQIQLKEPQLESSTAEAQGNFTRFTIHILFLRPGHQIGNPRVTRRRVQPEINPEDQHQHSQTPDHNLST
jgi:hypothetical protein